MKGIYVLNIIIQNIMDKRNEVKGLWGNTQNLNAPSRGI
jgi:hypothetical protein